MEPQVSRSKSAAAVWFFIGLAAIVALLFFYAPKSGDTAASAGDKSGGDKKKDQVIASVTFPKEDNTKTTGAAKATSPPKGTVKLSKVGGCPATASQFDFYLPSAPKPTPVGYDLTLPEGIAQPDKSDNPVRLDNDMNVRKALSEAIKVEAPCNGNSTFASSISIKESFVYFDLFDVLIEVDPTRGDPFWAIRADPNFQKGAETWKLKSKHAPSLNPYLVFGAGSCLVRADNGGPDYFSCTFDTPTEQEATLVFQHLEAAVNLANQTRIRHFKPAIGYEGQAVRAYYDDSDKCGNRLRLAAAPDAITLEVIPAIPKERLQDPKSRDKSCKY